MTRPTPFAISRTRLPVRATLGLALATALLAGCGTGNAAEPAAGDPSPTASTPSPTSAPYAFSADNCGVEVTREQAPERIVTVKSAMTELVLALGAGDRLVAVAYPDGPVPAEFTDTVADLPVLAERVPTGEAVLAMEPDLVLAGWESVFSTDGAGERASLSDLDVTTFVAPSACTQAPYAPDPLTFDDVFAEITQVGDLLGTPEEAATLIQEQRLALETATDQAGDGQPSATALWWSSGSDTPYVGAGSGAPQMIMDEVGLTNIAGDLAGGWAPYSWEAVAAADPEVIVLVDSSWNSAEKKKATLEANPVTAALSAVANERYLIVPFAATEAGVRNVEAVTSLLTQRSDLAGHDSE